MPGGSINGRPFRESRDAYSRTGIPCGNPRRFHSSDVVRVEPGSRSKSRPIDGPLEDIETAGQQQLQTILQKQLNTDVTISQQLGQKRSFTKGAEFSPVTEELVGARTLDDFRTLGDIDAYIEEMKGYGLTQEEILYKLRADENESSPHKKGKLANPEFHDARIREIEEKITQKKQQLDQPDTFSNVKPLSRHEMDLEKAIAQSNTQNKFLHDTLIKQKTSAGTSANSEHFSAIPEILNSMTESIRVNFSKKKLKHRKDQGYKEECTLECCVPVEETGCAQCLLEDKNRTDKSHDHACKSCDHEPVVATCMERPSDFVSKDEKPKETKIMQKPKKESIKSTSFCVITDCKITERTNSEHSEFQTELLTHLGSDPEIRVLDSVEPIPVDAIMKYKLSAEEVKKIPRFENYSSGEPNNVLFVKNLSPKLTEEDLASLFIGFQTSDTSRIVFKLLNGKMKGQAFVTFPDVDTACKALDLVHGYEFKGRPVIIQYGKKQTANA